jgi:Tol biopolymer transport system component
VAEVRVVGAAGEATPQPAAAEVAAVRGGKAQNVASSRRLAAAVLAALALTAVGIWLIEGESAPSSTLRVTRFVVTPPASAPLANLRGYDVAISPGGERLAYFAQDSQTGSVALYVRELDALEARRLPGTDVAQPGGGSNMNPFFSPDGRSIGFRSPGRGIVRVAVDGALPDEIIDDAHAQQPAFLGGAWAANDTLIYSSGRRLQRVSADGGTPEQLTPEPEAAASGITTPFILPGERAVLFNETPTDDVAVLDLTTGEKKVLVRDGDNPMYASTGHIVFARGTTLMAVRFNLAELTVTGEPVVVLQGVRHPGTAADYALSANGTLAYVPAREGASAVVWVDRNGRVVERAISDLVVNPRDPRLSPEAGRLVLTTDVLMDGDLWAYDLGGRPPILLTAIGNNASAVWSPDGMQVAFLRGDCECVPPTPGDADMFTTRADGSLLDPQPLRPDGLSGAPAFWSSEGETFFIRGQNGVPPDIVATPVTPSGEVHEVVVTDNAEFDPALSPDGRWLAYASDRTGQAEIWVKGYPDGIPVRVSHNGGYEPIWSADGRELFYLQGNSMMVVAVETAGEFSFGAPVQLFSEPYFTSLSPYVRSYDVASDGRFLMIQPQDAEGAASQSSIVVVQNWTEELKRLVPTE